MTNDPNHTDEETIVLEDGSKLLIRKTPCGKYMTVVMDYGDEGGVDVFDIDLWERSELEKISDTLLGYLVVVITAVMAGCVGAVLCAFVVRALMVIAG